MRAAEMRKAEAEEERAEEERAEVLAVAEVVAQGPQAWAWVVWGWVPVWAAGTAMMVSRHLESLVITDSTSLLGTPIHYQFKSCQCLSIKG